MSSPCNAASRRCWWDIAALALGCGLLYFCCTSRAPLDETIPDEGWYATVTREMALSGDYLAPTYLGEHFFEKPPLFYWGQAVSFRLFGFSEFAVRLPAGLFGLLTVLAVHAFAARLFDRRTGLLAAGICATTVLMWFMSRIGMMDTLFTLCLTVALFSLYGAVHAETKRYRLFLLASLAIGLAALAKGPLGICFPAAIGGLYLMLTGNLALLKQAPWILGTMILLALLSWYGVMLHAHGQEFVDVFFVKHHWTRVSSSQPDQWYVWPVWFYCWAVPVFFLPWSFFLLAALGSALVKGKRLLDAEERPTLFFLLWAGVMMAVFTAANGKWFHYMLPAYPALAVLTARHILLRTDVAGTGRSWGLRLAAILPSGVILFAAILVSVRMGTSGTPWLVAAALGAIGLSILGRLAFGPIRLVPWTLLGFWSAAVLVGIWIRASEGQDGAAYKPLALEINRRAQPGDRVCFFHPRQPHKAMLDSRLIHQAMTFYLEPPARVLSDEHELRETLAGEGRVFCVIEEAVLADSPVLRAALPYAVAKRPVSLFAHRLRAAAGRPSAPNVLVVVCNRPLQEP